MKVADYNFGVRFFPFLYFNPNSLFVVKLLRLVHKTTQQDVCLQCVLARNKLIGSLDFGATDKNLNKCQHCCSTLKRSKHFQLKWLKGLSKHRSAAKRNAEWNSSSYACSFCSSFGAINLYIFNENLQFMANYYSAHPLIFK